MEIKGRYDFGYPKGRVFHGKPVVNSAGYVPPAKRIEKMIQMGVKMSGLPLYQSDTAIPLDRPIVQGNKTVHDTLEGAKTLQETVKSTITNQEKLAVEALKKAAVDEYISNQPKAAQNPVAAPSDANTEVK